ncbi:MAG: type II toxin-antitoxin system RelE/ParE family toxin [Thiohalocapsa sp.]
MDLRDFQRPYFARIGERLSQLVHGLLGNIQRLTIFTPEYGLRAGNYRVLVEIEGTTAVVYRVVHRKRIFAKR